MAAEENEKTNTIEVDKEMLMFALNFVTFNTIATMLRAGVTKDELVATLENVIHKVKAY